VLGALNARMRAVAGELADGVLLNSLPAWGVPWCVEQVRAAEAAAGRQPGACTVYAYVHVGVTDLDSARAAAQADLFSYAVVDSYAAAFRRTGFADEVDAIRSAHAARDRRRRSPRWRPDDPVVDIVGRPPRCRPRAAYEAAYVDHAVVMPLPWGTDRDRVIADTLAAAAPGA
jgi:alkanesulfonate monooxygenase SsuD/methylene tetrahydromethanopterin reductase-like flavin-dependent oxidoreductase (luciferase family)